MVDRLKSAGIQISLSGVNESVREVLRRPHLLEKIGREHLYTISSRAITLVHQRVHEGNESSMAECPMTMTSEVTEKG